MQIEQLKKIFEFIEARENKYSIVWKAMNGLPFTKEQLKIKGNLDLQGMDVKKLPNGLHVTGNLLLNFTTIKKLPMGLKVGGDLELQDCENLKSLPNDLKVRKGLWLSGSPLGRLPNEKILNMVKPNGYIGQIY